MAYRAEGDRDLYMAYGAQRLLEEKAGKQRKHPMRDCTRCGGFGELVTKTDDGRLGGYVTCVDCDGYGILPSDGQAWRLWFKYLVAASTGAALVLTLVVAVLAQLPGVCR